MDVVKKFFIVMLITYVNVYAQEQIVSPWPCDNIKIRSDISLNIVLEKYEFTDIEKIPFSVKITNNSECSFLIANPLSFGYNLYLRIFRNGKKINYWWIQYGLIPGDPVILIPNKSIELKYVLDEIEEIKLPFLEPGNYFIDICYEEIRASESFLNEARQDIKCIRWPGNIRSNRVAIKITAR